MRFVGKIELEDVGALIISIYVAPRDLSYLLLGRDRDFRHVIAPSPHVPRPTWVA